MVVKYVLGLCNKYRGKWVYQCTVNGQIIMNTWFEELPSHLWRSPAGDSKKNQTTTNDLEILNSKTSPSGESNQFPVIRFE